MNFKRSPKTRGGQSKLKNTDSDSIEDKKPKVKKDQKNKKEKKEKEVPLVVAPSTRSLRKTTVI